jgi:hypothetical protein
MIGIWGRTVPTDLPLGRVLDRQTGGRPVFVSVKALEPALLPLMPEDKSRPAAKVLNSSILRLSSGPGTRIAVNRIDSLRISSMTTADDVTYRCPDERVKSAFLRKGGTSPWMSLKSSPEYSMTSSRETPQVESK